jgi:hypothetical protein
VGLEADITATGIDRSRSVTFNPAPFTTQKRIGSAMGFLGTARGRLARYSGLGTCLSHSFWETLTPQAAPQ